jgi:hypothetical protein
MSSNTAEEDRDDGLMDTRESVSLSRKTSVNAVAEEVDPLEWLDALEQSDKHKAKEEYLRLSMLTCTTITCIAFACVYCCNHVNLRAVLVLRNVIPPIL